jgi:hypothetical protein
MLLWVISASGRCREIEKVIGADRRGTAQWLNNNNELFEGLLERQITGLVLKVGPVCERVIVLERVRLPRIVSETMTSVQPNILFWSLKVDILNNHVSRDESTL